MFLCEKHQLVWEIVSGSEKKSKAGVTPTEKAKTMSESRESTRQVSVLDALFQDKEKLANAKKQIRRVCGSHAPYLIDRCLPILQECHMVQLVLPCDDNPDASLAFVYTIGIQWRWGHPDLILLGLAHQGQTLLNNIAQLIAQRKLNLQKTSEIGKGLVANTALRARKLSLHASQDMCAMATLLAQGLQLPVPNYVQVIWPEADGTFTQTRRVNSRQYLLDSPDDDPGLEAAIARATQGAIDECKTEATVKEP